MRVRDSEVYLNVSENVSMARGRMGIKGFCLPAVCAVGRVSGDGQAGHGGVESEKGVDAFDGEV